MASSQTQKGIITYALSSNRQKPFAGASRSAVFNTYRRSKGQFLYVVPPFAAAYLLMNWAIEKYVSSIYIFACGSENSGKGADGTLRRNEFYNSKEGRMKAPEESDDATQGGTLRQALPSNQLSFLSPLPHTMAKEKPAAADGAEEKRLKKEKKDQKKRSETDGVHKSSSTASAKKEKSSSDKKTKKDKDPSKTKKKENKEETSRNALNGGGEEEEEEEEEMEDVAGSESRDQVVAADAKDVTITTQLLNTLEAEKPGSVVVKEKDDGDVDVKVKTVLRGALVPFANPLADEKVGRKVLKGVKRAAKHKTLKRGVKEVVKALRKSPPSNSSASASASASPTTLPPAIVILAADISPMDVISHLPVLCEDHAVP
ncbi:MAG: hypothetical protein Q9210_004365, partial [Variospora velana]